MYVPRTQHSPLAVTELVEHEQRVIAALAELESVEDLEGLDTSVSNRGACPTWAATAT